MEVDPPCQRSVSTSTGMPAAINNCVLAYCVAQMAQRPKEQIKTVLLINFTKDEILNAKKMIWETCQSKLDRLVQRVDTSVRGAECANADDILNALLQLQSTSDLPPIVLCASAIVRLPKYSTGELLEPSLAERLAVVEGQLLQMTLSRATPRHVLSLSRNATSLNNECKMLHLLAKADLLIKMPSRVRKSKAQQVRIKRGTMYR